jgi:hypothetical protein
MGRCECFLIFESSRKHEVCYGLEAFLNALLTLLTFDERIVKKGVNEKANECAGTRAPLTIVTQGLARRRWQLPSQADFDSIFNDI